VELSVSVGDKLGTGVGVTSSLLFYRGKKFCYCQNKRNTQLYVHRTPRGHKE